MKTIIFLMLLNSVSYADVYVITRPDHSLYSVSPADNAVVPDGYIKQVIKDRKVEDLNLPADSSIYDFDKNGFSVNAKRAKEARDAEATAAVAAQTAQESRASAIKKIQSTANLTDDEAKALFY